MENSNQSIVDNDEVIFADEDEMIVADEPINLSPSAQDSWKILLVDDDVEIHKVTILALGDLEFEGKPVTFFNAYSGEDAKQIIRENSDIAMILLDVIMKLGELFG